MKRKTKIRIAWICAIVFLICVIALPIIGFLSPAKADERPWKVRINGLNFSKGEVADYSVTGYGMVHLKFTDGREYMTHWNNVLMYKE